MTTLGAFDLDSLWEADRSAAELATRPKRSKSENQSKIHRILKVFDRYNVRIKDRSYTIKKLLDEPDGQYPTYRVAVTTRHRDFAQLSFHLVKYKAGYYLDASTVKILDPEEVGVEEVKDLLQFSEDNSGQLLMEASLKLSNKGRTGEQVGACVMENAMFRKIDIAKSQDELGNHISSGTWGGKHFSKDKRAKFMGVVTYTFQYTFSEDTFHIRYADFQHHRRTDALHPDEASSTVSKFKTLGPLQLDYDDLPKTKINQEQYQALLKAVKQEIQNLLVCSNTGVRLA